MAGDGGGGKEKEKAREEVLRQAARDAQEPGKLDTDTELLHLLPWVKEDTNLMLQ